MIVIRPATERGHADHGWLDTRHTFSFASYHDPRHVGFRSLRVINEDRVKPGEGFGTHAHRDMEILTWVLEGGLEHKDSMGNGSVIRPGDIQRMSAGTGVMHSECNHSSKQPAHLLQIWILPEQKGLSPSYEQKAFPEAERKGTLRLVASRDGKAGSVTIHQDAMLYAAILEKGQEVEHPLEPGRHGWVQVARGSLTLNGAALQAGDGASASGERPLRITAKEESEFLLFDLA